MIRNGDHMCKVLWNNEMDLCIGLTTELDKEEFIEEIRRTHFYLTGEQICTADGIIYEDEDIWKFELN